MKNLTKHGPEIDRPMHFLAYQIHFFPKFTQIRADLRKLKTETKQNKAVSKLHNV